MARAANPGPRPKERIGWILWIILQSIAGIFDALKFFAATIIFTAPFMAGAVAGAIATNHASTAACWAGATAVAPVAILVGPSVMQEACDTASNWGATHAQAVGAIAAGGAAIVTGVLEVVGGPVTEIVEDIGAAFAMVLDIVAWIILGGLFILILAMHPAGDTMEIVVTAMLSFGAGEIPIAGALFPTTSFGTWKIVRVVRKADSKKIAAWEAKNTAWLREQAADRAAYAAQMQARSAQQQEDRAAQEEAEFEAANDNEIPDTLPAAA